MNKWTDDQLSAITSRGGSLLVSAAAGSGKTAVLVERIIRRVIEEKIDINRFLVVTYTNAAAKEMKEKVVRAIAGEISKNPKNLFLREQLSLVHKAQITTVHSFCFNLIRENFTQLKISPDFKIASEVDTGMMQNDIISAIIARRFIEMSEDFRHLADILGEKNIEETMLKIYRFTQSNSDPIKYLQNVQENYENVVKNGFDTSNWFEIICQKLEKQLEICLNLSNLALDLCEEDTTLKDKNLDKLTIENATFSELYEDIKAKKWDLLHIKIKNINFDRWSSCTKSENLEIAKEAQNIREEYKERIEDLKPIIYMSLEEIGLQAQGFIGMIEIIKNILIEFEYEYSAEKNKRNLLDFNDAEHKMIELLYDKVTGEKSSIAKEISNKFIEVMVDEYQDTNEIQDTLFKLLSNDEKNLFMVGDVKQSIYRFRLADPMIFLKKSIEYKPIIQAQEGEARKVSLSKNFRSRDEVLQSTNFIFENIMTKETGPIEYTDDQRLYLGATYPDYDNAKAEFCLIDYDKFGVTKTQTELEAEVVASKIADMIENKFQVYDSGLGVMRDVNLSDIVILLRSTSTKAYTYKKALEDVGINIDFKEGSEKLFGTPEVSNFISLLKILDNHLLDVDFVAIMRSKIFDFSDEEIAEIRLENPDCAIYTSVQKSKQQKAVDFLQNLAEIKQYSQNNSIFRTIWYVVHKYDLLAKYALMTNGAIRRSNILRFLDFLNTLDDGFTLYDFVNFLDNVSNKETSVPSGVATGYSVKIMTMHSSKGLEFPVVFLADIAKGFNKNDFKEPIIMHNSLGIALKYIDEDNIVSYPSIMQNAIKLRILDELKAEEMRILYVAMTRAKEKMFVMCTLKKAEKVFESWLGESDFLESNSYHNWFGACIAKLPSAKIYYNKFGITDNIKINASLGNYFDCKYIDSITSIQTLSKKSLKKTDVQVLDFEYPYLDSAKIPSKLTATAAFAQESENINKTIKKPKFLSDMKLSATERGIAHHIVMQFIRFDMCTDLQTIKSEIKRLYDDKFITKVQYECINPWKIDAFINSKIGDRLRASDEVIREFKFSVLSKASNFFDTKSQDDVLLQGVVDCMFIENGGIVVVDYKTDAVNEKNIDEISAEHKKQLEIYSTALEEIFDMKVVEKYLYYFKTESFYQI
ncbi:MAG: helicase-exonuclease AddAB subunit AddA [Clostridia bacterium]